jgi:hypothetical protein
MYSTHTGKTRGGIGKRDRVLRDRQIETQADIAYTKLEGECTDRQTERQTVRQAKRLSGTDCMSVTCDRKLKRQARRQNAEKERLSTKL